MLETVALAVHLQDVHVVGEVVQQRSGEAFRAEDLGPLVEGKVGGRQDGIPLVALAEDSKSSSAPVRDRGTKPSSSMISIFGRESRRCKLNSRRLVRRPWEPPETASLAPSSGTSA